MAEREDSQETGDRQVYPRKRWRSHGTFLKVPFDFRVPTLQRIRERWWNPDESKVFTPRVFGIGWTLNFHRVLSLLGLVKKDGQRAARGEREEPEDDSAPRDRSG